MPLKKILKNCPLIAVVLTISLFLSTEAPVFAVCLSFGICLLRTDFATACTAVLLCILSIMPRCDCTEPQSNEGRVIRVAQKYAVILQGRKKVILYTEALPLLDSDVRFQTAFEPIESPSGFYRFSFAGWAAHQGIHYGGTAVELTVVQEHFSFRSLIQKRIRKADDPGAQRFLYKVLLNISAAEDHSFLYRDGWSLAGILAVSDSVLALFLREKERQKCSLSIHVLLCILFHFPLLAAYRLILCALSFSRLRSVQKNSLAVILCIVLYGRMCISSGWIMAVFFRFSYLFAEKDRALQKTLMLGLQSILFGTMDALRMLLYPVTVRISGIFWLLGCLQLLIPSFPAHVWMHSMDLYEKILSVFELPGTVWGAGLILYLLAVSCVTKKNRGRAAFGLMLAFQYCGLFHPLAEMTLINVAQGDAILIRQPFARCDVLIDTGKPEQEMHLDTFLQYKGIRALQTLFITHDDADHSGSRDFIRSKYHAEVIEEHFESRRCGRIVFYDLNEIENEDKNQSCLVLYTRIGGKKILLMGDADSTAEEQIVRRYPQLHCDICKLGHHGSNTSSCDLFLDTVRPSLALISSGPYRLYHHPSPETIQRMLKRHIPYFDTKEEGDISLFFVFGKTVLLTSQGKIAIF